MVCKTQTFQIGDKVQVVNTTPGKNPAGNFATDFINQTLEITGILGECLYFNNKNKTWVCKHNVKKVGCDKVSVSCLETKIACLKDRLSCAESRLGMMKELGLDEIDATEFRIYAALRAMQAEDQTDVEKAKTIAHIVKSC